MKLKDLLNEGSKEAKKILNILKSVGEETNTDHIDRFLDDFLLDRGKVLAWVKRNPSGMANALFNPGSKERLLLVKDFVRSDAKWVVRVKLSFGGWTAISKPMSKKEAEEFQKQLNSELIKGGTDITVKRR